MSKLRDYIENLIIENKYMSLQEVSKEDKRNLISLMYEEEQEGGRLDFIHYSRFEDATERFKDYMHDVIHRIDYNQEDFENFMYMLLKDYYHEYLDEIYDEVVEAVLNKCPNDVSIRKQLNLYNLDSKSNETTKVGPFLNTKYVSGRIREYNNRIMENIFKSAV